MTVSTPDLGPIGALARGASETWETLSVTVRGIGMLFRGVDVTQAVAGPIRITYFVGEVATQGMSTGLGGGLRAFFSFLSLLSVALFFMNLLPIPVLDGGQILLYAVEGISRRELHPKLVYGYQMVGMVLVFMLLFFALFNDILFLSGR
jgi:regulator of sigma E protease